MPHSLAIRFTSGATLYAIRTRAADAAWFSVAGEEYEEAGGSAFEDYIIELVEIGGLGWYVSIDPDPDGEAGGYLVMLQAGVSPDATDVLIGQGSIGLEPAQIVAATEEVLAILADHIVRRSMISAEASEHGDELDLLSLYGMIQAAFEASRNGGVLTVRKNDDTVLGTRDLTIDEDALPVTGVS